MSINKCALGMLGVGLAALVWSVAEIRRIWILEKENRDKYRKQKNHENFS